MCLGKTVIRPCLGTGTLEEFSTRKNITFGMCVFGKMRVMGEIISEYCVKGMDVVVFECGVNEKGLFYKFATLDKTLDSAERFQS